MAKWVSQGGMKFFPALFFLTFFLFGLFSFFDIPEISQEITKTFPKLSEEKKKVDDFKKSCISPETLIRVILMICIFILSWDTVQMFRELLLNPIKEKSRNFVFIFNSGLITISMSIGMIIISFFQPIPENITFLNNVLFWAFPFTTIFLFCLNLILWTLTHIALYCKAKSAKQENTEQIQA